MVGSKLIYDSYEERSEGTVDVVIGQPNFDPYQKFQSLTQAQQNAILLEEFSRVLPDSLQRPVMLLAPETFTGDIVLTAPEESATQRTFRQFLAAHPGAELLFGASTYDIYDTHAAPSILSRPYGSGWIVSHNSALMARPEGPFEHYHKSKLVIGVEMTPWPKIFVPLDDWLSAKMATLGEKHWDKHFNLGGELTALAEEAYTNYPATKAFNREAYLQEKYDDLSQRHQRNGIFGNFLSSIVQPVIVFVDALAYIAVALLGGWLIVHRGMPIGTVVTVILFARQLSAPLERIAFGLSYVQHVKSAAKRVFNLLDLPEEEDPAETAQAPTKGRVEFRNVDFSYDPEKPLIRNLSFSVQPGQKVAIVGPTGAGKTTIVNLLMRFYDIQKGQILIDGEDISKLSRADTRRRFGMVLQDTWLFKGTVAENVAYGNPEATREEIERACDLAYCDHFIRRLPQGYDSVISEDSTAVSSGQKQLLTIARALLADRSLLILDEATSNVDTRTELLIQKAMDRLMGGRTCFVIAHRLSTIVDADCILVIRDGQIVEQGTHRELLDQKGFYYELFNSQYKI